MEMFMSEMSVGRVESFSDPGRKIVDIGGVEVAVFHLGGEFRAYENICPHLAGPACQGMMLPRTLDNLKEDNVNISRTFSKSQHNVICPWHGWEFDILTGEHVMSTRHRLRKVVVRVSEGEVFIVVPDRRHQHLNSTLLPERGRGRIRPSTPGDAVDRSQGMGIAGP
jgi:nitrite reductase/ring-hydroxylating ferredoxin subunit